MAPRYDINGSALGGGSGGGGGGNGGLKRLRGHSVHFFLETWSGKVGLVKLESFA